MTKPKKKKPALNLEMQKYKGIPFRLINRAYGDMKAKRFTLNGSNQNVWIPNKHLLPDGTLRSGENIDYVFDQAPRQVQLANLVWQFEKGKKRGYVLGPGVDRRPKKENAHAVR